LLPLWLWSLLATTCGMAAQIDRLDVARDANLFKLNLNAYLDAPPDAVWATLTDYPNLHRLAEAVQLSEVIGSNSDGSRLVHTRSHICVWIFCRDLEHVQRMRDDVPGRLQAHSVPEQSDFAYGFARWLLLPQGSGTRFKLTAQLRPDFWVPPVLGPYLIEQGLRNTALEALQGLEREARHAEEACAMSRAEH
jgi:hypothetical protein